MQDYARFRIPHGFFIDGEPVRARVKVREVCPGDEEYPGLLSSVEKPPVIFVAGRDLRELSPRVAVIGARRATGYGLRVATQLAADLSSQGICVVSGLARGADSAAHQGALLADGGTIAVMGCGPDVCYPTGSRSLYAEIAARGAVVSTYPPGTEVMNFRLKDRNALLVALSTAVVVVQGDETSAAVETGRTALDMNRDLFVVPGSIEWSMSRGVHGLLKTDGAHLCTGASDVIEKAFKGIVDDVPPEKREIPEHLPEAQRLVLGVLALGPLSEQRIVSLAELDAIQGSRAIAALELRGYIARAGGALHRIR